jgi:hypothetical protein
VLLIIQNRQLRREKSNLRYLDRLYMGSYKRADILSRLAYDTFLAINDRRVTPGYLPPVNQLLTEITGRWVGNQLARDTLERRSLRQLHAMASKCAELLPKDANQFYRLGAIECILRDEKKALSHFQQAGRLDLLARDIDPVSEMSVASIFLDHADNQVGEKRELTLAKFAAHAARAINTANEFTLGRLREMMHESMYVKLYGMADEKNFSMRVIEKMLNQASNELKKQTAPA